MKLRLLPSRQTAAPPLRSSPPLPAAAMALRALFSTAISRVPHRGLASAREASKLPRFAVIGHRGKGMNVLSSSDPRMRAFKENSVLSFNEAARFPVDFVEFDVQVTRDGYPIVFHDDFILTEQNGDIHERRVTELLLEEFLSYGPQKKHKNMGKALHRRSNNGRILSWEVEDDDSLCTLQEVFQQVDSRLGFNIELKFDDHAAYHEEELNHTLHLILQVVYQHAKGRPIIFSTFHPDAAQLMRRLQGIYPVFFLTEAGSEIYSDPRRNSLEEAVRLCRETGLHGIVSEVQGILRNPMLLPEIKKSNLQLLTYGQLNNFSESVYMQYMMGVDGVIVDLVEEITKAVSNFDKHLEKGVDGRLHS